MATVKVIDTTRLEQNKQSRQQAEAIVDLIAEVLSENTHAFGQRFLRVIAEYIWEQLDAINRPHPEKDPPPPPMTDEESQAFEKKRFTFGKFRDTEISSVPFSYLEWFADLPETDLKLQLRRYLNSPRIKLERDHSSE